MQFNDVSGDMIHRLATLRTDGPRVLSLYLDLDPSIVPTASHYRTNVTSLIDRGRHGATSASCARDVERAREFLLEADVRGTRSIACFASEELGLWQSLRVPGPVTSTAGFANAPSIEPLIDGWDPVSLTILVADREHALVWRGDAHRIEPSWEHSWEDDRDSNGRSHGRSGGHGDRGERSRPLPLGFLKRIAAALDARDHRDELLIIVADAHLAREILHHAREETRNSVIGYLPHIERPPADELLRQISPLLDEWRAERDGALYESLRTKEAHHHATTRFENVVQAINLVNVDRLLYQPGCVRPGYECPHGDWLSIAADECPSHGDGLVRTENLLEPMLRRALRTGATVRAVESHLDDCVAAELRFVAEPVSGNVAIQQLADE